MFLDDALLASKILDITLTSRNKGGRTKSPSAAFLTIPCSPTSPG